ncbi:uncharacterized protein LOC131023263 [Salvia miltiorrhiza]|uniref:uncharacterized protein LOC131023263 n=1 Tax=Salvia miltiorrhiza TaxID=226208 RepID=UPI0025AD637D|nr:uncharacterized protein LOC131023263 [Salvia miltiorrhiza]
MSKFVAKLKHSVVDRPFWPIGKLNSYSVKSGYILANSIKQRNEASSSSLKADLWQWVWGLEVISKVKLFMWKCLVGALPTTYALSRRAMDVDLMCRRCGEHEETLEHAIRDCHWASFLWECSPLRLPPVSVSDQCSVDVWFDRIRKIPHAEVHNSFATLTWSIWYARNVFLFQGKTISHEECLAISLRATWSPPFSSPPMSGGPRCVICSRDNQILISCDAAIDNNGGMGYGTVLTNFQGNIAGCSFGFLEGAYTAEEGETVAIREGALCCKCRGDRDIILETNCQPLYWKLLRRSEDLSYIGDTLSAIFEISTCFIRCSFSWTPREGNALANRLAKFALSGRFFPTVSEVLPALLNSHFD